ncbi:hypothetical protein FBU59_000768 [Linderina macrospora]|uniref:Uncharacterized protein n=1 Tax=Linderina macrospora TaxID=4868 RepID=A0ACC1JG51_9FUNG|nr:hypothetical protein FBU59_000768 [Linderina macrospora]
MDLVPMHQVYKSLVWTDQVLLGTTGTPYAFESLMGMSSGLAYAPIEERPAFMGAFRVTLDLSEQPITPERTTLESALYQATTDYNYAFSLSSLCRIYYFLRRLTPFNLDDQSLDKLISTLQSDDLAGDDTTDALDACLGQLEAEYPGIKLFVNFVRLEANIMQESRLSLEPFDTLRAALPQDGELYLKTLQCVADCLQRNAGITQMLNEVRKLYDDSSLAEFWPAASGLVWEINDAAAADIQQFDDDEDDGEFGDDEFGTIDDDGAKSIAESFHTAEMPAGIVQ